MTLYFCIYERGEMSKCTSSSVHKKKSISRIPITTKMSATDMCTFDSDPKFCRGRKAETNEIIFQFEMPKKTYFCIGIAVFFLLEFYFGWVRHKGGTVPYIHVAPPPQPSNHLSFPPPPPPSPPLLLISPLPR